MTRQEEAERTGEAPLHPGSGQPPRAGAGADMDRNREADPQPPQPSSGAQTWKGAVGPPPAEGSGGRPTVGDTMQWATSQMTKRLGFTERLCSISHNYQHTIYHFYA